MTTEQLSKAIRAYLEAVLAPDGPQTLSNYVSDEEKMTRALLLVLDGMDEWNRGDGYSPRAELLMRDIARELGIGGSE